MNKGESNPFDALTEGQRAEFRELMEQLKRFSLRVEPGKPINDVDHKRIEKILKRYRELCFAMGVGV